MKRLNYRSALKYLCVFACFFCCFKAISGVPLGLAALPAFLFEGFNFIAVFVFFALSAFSSFGFIGGCVLCLSAAFLCGVYYVYKRKRARVGAAGCLYSAIALVPYVFSPVFLGTLYEKLIYSAVITACAIPLSVCAGAVYFKRLRKKLSEAELCAAAVCITVLSLGFINAFSLTVWQGLALFALLSTCCVYKSPRAFVFAFILAIAPCVYKFSLEPLAEYFIYCALALLAVRRSKLLAAISAFCCSACFIWFSSGFNLPVGDYILNFLPCVCFLFFPKKAYDKIAAALCAFDENDVLRELINDERRTLAAKLYSLSNAFYGLEDCALRLDKYLITGDNASELLAEKIIQAVCADCKKRADCLRYDRPVKRDLLKMLNLGTEKGRISLIDVPKDFSEYCRAINAILYEANKALDELLKQRELMQGASGVRSLVRAQAGGAAGVLKSLSYELSERVCFKSKREKTVFDALCLNGLIPAAVVCVGEDELHLIFTDKNADVKLSECVISRAVGMAMGLSARTDIGRGIACTYKRRPRFDAAFGVVGRKKDGSLQSGDTHSLTKIGEGRFLVALCDGMGSGESAHEGSVLAIELVEALASAGLNAEAVAGVSNDMLSLCSSESFSTLDMAIIDLYAGICDLLKVGAAFGLVITADGVKVIENSALPLGIIEELAPSTCAIDLSGGEIIVLMSDGVTDAFFSSAEIVDFLEREKCANPQGLAEKILTRAIENSGGVAADDMTCLAVKIYKNDCA